MYLIDMIITSMGQCGKGRHGTVVSPFASL